MATDTIALTYRRVSTYHQERDGVSLDVQTDQCLDYIRRQPGWRLGGDFHDTLTGRTAKRKDYQHLLEEARQLRARGQQVVVVTAALDRMGRDLEESVRSRKELKTLEVSLVCIREGGVLQELQSDIYASIAADESRRNAARVRGSRKRRRQHGYRVTSRAPWGYVWGPASDTERLADAPPHVLRPDPSTAEYVREAWQRAADGMSIRRVAAWVQGLHSEARGGRTLDFANILRMFKNVTYISRVADPGRASGRMGGIADLEALTLPRGRWEALVGDEIWTRVQERIALHHRVPRQARGEYLLTGLLRCPRCGLRMQGRQQARTRLYSCATPNSGCGYGGRADVINRASLTEIAMVLDALTRDATILRRLRTAWAKLQKPERGPDDRRVRTLEQSIEQARRRQDAALDLLVDRAIDRETYSRKVEREQAEIEAVQHELAEMRAIATPPVLPSFETVLRDTGSWKEIMTGPDIAAQRDVLALLINGVVPERISRGQYRTTITWTPVGTALRQMSDVTAAA
jgi:site-specific DNA recombinase